MRTAHIIFLGVLSVVLGASTSRAEDHALSVGAALPPIRLQAPADAAQRGYLGLAPKSDFTIDQIQAEVVIVQIFSMYCPICQREASKVNQLFSAVERNAELRRRVKIIGIGAGNSPYEVDFFRKSFQVPFPIFADADFDIHKQLGEVRTPYFIGLRLAAGKPPLIKLTHAGPFESAERFLTEITGRCAIP